jgi:selT/selW/selH-like putative selenoprotein
VYDQYSQIIHASYPDLKITGENYPPSPIKATLAQILSVLKLVLIGFIMSGRNLFTYLNIQTPNAYTWALENKFYACLMLFFISNAVETQLVSTGAFEIYLNGKLALYCMLIPIDEYIDFWLET